MDKTKEERKKELTRMLGINIEAVKARYSIMMKEDPKKRTLLKKLRDEEIIKLVDEWFEKINIS